MGIVKRISKYFTEVSAAVLAPIGTPKGIKSKRQTFPSFVTTAAPSDAILPQSDLTLANTEITTFRDGLNSKEVIRNFSKSSPDLASAATSVVRLAITSGYIIKARNLDGTLNVEATALAQQLATRFDKLSQYEKGFTSSRSMRSNSEALAMEIIRYGSCSVELVLGPSRLPVALVPVSTTQIVFRKGKESKLVPYQVIGAEEVSLDVPTFFYTSLDQDLLEPYSDPPMQAAVQPIIGSQEFIDDLRRVFKKAISPRMTAVIDEDKFRKTIPSEIAHDPDKVKAYMNEVIVGISNVVNDLNPEDALVYFDSIDFTYLTAGNNSLEAEITVFNKILNGKLAAGAHSMPVVLGHEATGSTNIASTQSMLFVKTVEGMVQEKLNEIYSRALTLAVRLFGMDVTVEFKYGSIDLRPSTELEAFRSMKQSRILELWSYGVYTKEETSLELTGELPSLNMPELSGTLFFSKKDAIENPSSNTSQGALDQTLDPDTPTQPKGAKEEDE